METQCNHSQYPILMKKNCTHNPSTSQVSKSCHPNPVTFPYPPDPGEHVLETSSAPTTLVERDKLDLSSLIPPKREMESPFSWTPYELHDDFLATLTRDRYLKFRHMDTLSFSRSSPSHHEPSKLKTSFSGESKHQTPSKSQTALNNYKKGPQRKAFFSQQEEISDDDEYTNAEDQFSTDPEPEKHSPYSVYQP